MVAILNDQIEEDSKQFSTTFDLPIEKVFFKLSPTATNNDVLKLTSFVQSYIDNDSMFIMNYSKLESQILKTTSIITAFTSSFTVVMLLLGAYQLILMIDQSLQASKATNAVVRAIGVTT